jgi:hypothetical protein
VQVVRYNNVITTNSNNQIVAEKFVNLPNEGAVYEEQEVAPVDGDDAAAVDPGEGPSGVVEPEALLAELSESEEEDVVEVEASRKRVLQFINEFETVLQFHD